MTISLLRISVRHNRKDAYVLNFVLYGACLYHIIIVGRAGFLTQTINLND